MLLLHNAAVTMLPQLNLPGLEPQTDEVGEVGEADGVDGIDRSAAA